MGSAHIYNQRVKIFAAVFVALLIIGLGIGIVGQSSLKETDATSGIVNPTKEYHGKFVCGTVEELKDRRKSVYIPIENRMKISGNKENADRANANYLLQAMEFPNDTWPDMKGLSAGELYASKAAARVARGLILGGGDLEQIKENIVKRRYVVNRRKCPEEVSLPEVKKELVDEILYGMKSLVDGRYASRCEMSQRLWNGLMGYNPSRFKDDENPVENISWRESKLLCDHLNNSQYVKSLAVRFELPICGDWQQLYMQIKNSSNWAECDNVSDQTEVGTHSVGCMTVDSDKVFDCVGNVWEWCACPPDKESELRCLGAHARGGGWESTCKPTWFLIADPDCGFSFIGIRLYCRKLSPKEST